MPETPENLRQRAARRRAETGAIYIELPGELGREIDLLKIKYRLGSRAEVIRRAVEIMKKA